MEKVQVGWGKNIKIAGFSPWKLIWYTRWAWNWDQYSCTHILTPEVAIYVLESAQKGGNW